MKKIIILLFVFSVIFFFFFSKKKKTEHNIKKKYKYNFSVIMNNIENNFEKDIKEGMINEAEKMNVSLNFNIPNHTNSSYGLKEFLDMNIYSKTDGIILLSDNEKDLKELVNKANKNNIPIITFIKDIENSSRKSFIGLNSYNIGIQFNNLLYKNNINSKDPNIALILQNEKNDILNEKSLLKGLKNKKLNIHIFRQSEIGPLSAEEITLDILKNYPKTDTFICSSPNITLGTLRALIDINKVNDVNILSFGISNEIKKYLKNGLIDYVIDVDFKNFGSDSIKLLYKVKTGIEVKETNYPDIKIIDKKI